jgi:hypothetical protein
MLGPCGAIVNESYTPKCICDDWCASIALVSFDISGTSVTHLSPLANGFATSFGFDLLVEEYFLTAGNGP